MVKKQSPPPRDAHLNPEIVRQKCGTCSGQKQVKASAPKRRTKARSRARKKRTTRRR